MGKIKIWFFCAALSFSFLAPVFSETIILKSGQKVEGKITEETDKYVKIDFEGVELTFYNDEIFSIDRSSSGEADTVSPQMEMLYKAYTSSLNSSYDMVEKEEVEPKEESVMENKDKVKEVSRDKVSIHLNNSLTNESGQKYHVVSAQK